jgi:hypothetical protein
MRTPFTLEALRNSAAGKLNPHLFAEKKKSKYGNVKEADDEGRVFDSKREAKRYKELKLLLKAGKIGFLARQTEFELNTGGSHSLVYRADFSYIDMATGKQVVEDAKGFATSVYKKKRKLMWKLYKIKIVEV